jgi:hypothetical protein
MPATPPEIPAQKKYHGRGLLLSHGYINVFRFSFTQTTVLANGTFIITVIG